MAYLTISLVTRSYIFYLAYYAMDSITKPDATFQYNSKKPDVFCLRLTFVLSTDTSLHWTNAIGPAKGMIIGRNQAYAILSHTSPLNLLLHNIQYNRVCMYAH